MTEFQGEYSVDAALLQGVLGLQLVLVVDAVLALGIGHDPIMHVGDDDAA